MPIPPGTSLGPYSVLGPLGSGGMGEVYRARDTRLDRDVAVKILPAHLAAHPESRARFEREARAVSSLNHPNICTLFDVGREGAVDYLVMECLEGQTLAQRLEKGPLPLVEVFERGMEIAAGLEAAHKRGIVHRDLKPGNIMLTRAGAKLLDFGLARAESLGEVSEGLTMTPTRTRPLTAEGTIVGTFQYMAPEQLEGKEADARTDLFALGAVLYEMATGKRAFDGKSQASLIGSIMSARPAPMSQVAPVTPPALERLVEACLAKDPDERCQSAHDVGMQLRWIATSTGADAPAAQAAASGGPARPWRLASLGLAILSTVLAIGLAASSRSQPAGPARAMRLLAMIPDQMIWRSWNSMAISPDGTQLVFYAYAPDGSEGLWLRSIDSFEVRRITGTDRGNPSFPFWSPDSRRIGFFADGKLKVVELSGAAPLPICEAPDGRGGAWGEDGMILFSPRPGAAIMKVSAAGGEPSPILALQADEPGGQMWPTLLPDRRHFLYLAIGSDRNDTWLSVGDLESSTRQRLTTAGSGAHLDPSGRILYQREGSLLAQRLDPQSWKLMGDPELISQAVATNRDSWYAALTLSKNGLLLYRNGADSGRQITWYTREGRIGEVLSEPGDVGAPSLSPDGTRLATIWSEGTDSSGDLWVRDLRTRVNSRLSFGEEPESDLVWSGDSRQVYYSAAHDGQRGIYVKPADGTREERLVLGADRAGSKEFYLNDLSRDGTRLILEVIVDGQPDIRIASVDGGGMAEPLVASKKAEGLGRLSPDGRWLAYVSEEPGRPEVFVRSMEAGGGKWQVSSAGGVQPRWRGDGSELYYLALDRQLTAVPIAPKGSALGAGAPQPLFRTPLPAVTGEYRYDVSSDGQRFAVVGPTEGQESIPITVILNWTATLRQEVR